jgi:hypothetical protein
MKVSQFLEHYGIERNPFAEEDAQTDPVFKNHCIDSTHHPAWDKVFGDPREPATSVVFGEKGAGKTAMRMQIAEYVRRHNQQHPDQKLFVVAYDDFNPFLDRFHGRTGARSRRADRVLSQWKLWDHMDAILALAVTSLVDTILQSHSPHVSHNPFDTERVKQLDRHQCRDLLLLATYYDQSTAETFKGRWRRLRRQVRFPTWKSALPFAAGCLGSLLAIGAWIWLAIQYPETWRTRLAVGGLLAAVAASWSVWGWRMLTRTWQAYRVTRSVRTGNRDVRSMRHALLRFTTTELAGQPCPGQDRTDDRYELLLKLQGVLHTLGFHGILVLVDRVDEPHLINGSAELMRLLIWPLLDNKFLKHPGLGVKLMLPIELTRYVRAEDREFFQRSRLDKQNVVSSFEWTGEALYDLANARMSACALDGSTPALRDLFEDQVTQQRLIEAFRTLRVPRRLFKFLYQLIVEHCHGHTDNDPDWKIDGRLFDTVLAQHLRHEEPV